MRTRGIAQRRGGDKRQVRPPANFENGWPPLRVRPIPTLQPGKNASPFYGNSKPKKARQTVRTRNWAKRTIQTHHFHPPTAREVQICAASTIIFRTPRLQVHVAEMAMAYLRTGGGKGKRSRPYPTPPEFERKASSPADSGRPADGCFPSSDGEKATHFTATGARVNPCTPLCQPERWSGKESRASAREGNSGRLGKDHPHAQVL